MDQSELLNLWAGIEIFIHSIVFRVLFFKFQFIGINVLFNVTILADDVKKQKCIFQYQMNINISYYPNIIKPKKKTKTKTSIMYNQLGLKETKANTISEAIKDHATHLKRSSL